MKPIIYSETVFKGNEIFNDEHYISPKFEFLNDTERIIENQQLSKEIFEVYVKILNEYPKCAKIKQILFTFVDDDDNFICSIKFYRINRINYKFKSAVIDWKGKGIVLRYEY